MILNEMFYSIQGEGMWAGTPTYFIRCYGCNLDCSWCDQPSALQNRPSRKNPFELSIEELSEIVSSFPINVPVCVTGGEPLQQHEDVVSLLAGIRDSDETRYDKEPPFPRRKFTIETNGTFFVSKLAQPDVFLSISPKATLLSIDGIAEMHGETEIRQWVKSGVAAQFKFVVENADHFWKIIGWLEGAKRKNPPIPMTFRSLYPLYFQPEYSKGREAFTLLLRDLSTHHEKMERIMALNFAEVRFTPQIHKTLNLR